MNDESRFLTTHEVSERTGIAEAWLKRARYGVGGPPFYQLGHRTVRYKLPEVEAWARESKKNANDRMEA